MNFMDVISEDLLNIYKSNVDWQKFNKSKVLISGCYGMLASYLVLELAYLNENIPDFRVDIYGIGRNVNKAQTRFGNIFKKDYFHFINEDISNEFNVGPIDYFIHAASLASPQYYNSNPVEVMEPNIFGTYYLLKYAANVKAKGFLFYSTNEIYGSEIFRKTITEDDFSTVQAQNIRNCYATSKIAGEAICAAFGKEYGVPVKEIRLSHTYGPTMDIKNDKRVFSSFVNNAVNNEDIVLKSKGEATRCFCYISDATIGAFLVLLNGKGPYNLSNNEQKCSIKNLAELIVKIKRGKIKLRFDIENKDLMRSNMIESPVFNSKRLNDLGWTPKVTLFDGFSRTIEYFQHH